jgi:hypothetical protein
VTVVRIAIDNPSVGFQCSAGLAFRNTDKRLSSVTRLLERPLPRIEREVTIIAAVRDGLPWKHILENVGEKRISPRTIYPAEAEGLTQVLSDEYFLHKEIHDVLVQEFTYVSCRLVDGPRQGRKCLRMNSKSWKSSKSRARGFSQRSVALRRGI